MKNITKSIIYTLCLLLFTVNTILAEGAFSIAHINAKYADDETTRDVLYEFMELESGLIANVHLEIVANNTSSSYKYHIVQYEDATKRTLEIASTNSLIIDFNSADLIPNIPLYLVVTENNNKVFTRLLTFRVKEGKVQGMFPDNIASEYTDAITVNMDELLPGMNLFVTPYVIPITTKTFTDGRIIVGLNIDSSHVQFWKDAYNGNLGSGIDAKELKDIFYGKSENKSKVSGKNMGLVVEFAGWLQGNLYNNDPLKGELKAYIGSGFAVSGQYMILTWDITVSVGVSGNFNYQIKFNPATSKYDDFEPERFSVQFTTGLELFGGIGVSSIAAAGIYGSGSISALNEFYPDPSVNSVVLAGECGFKVKLFSRTLFSYALVSGSHEFVDNNSNIERSALLNIKNMNSIDNYLLSNSYADLKGVTNEPTRTNAWFDQVNAPTTALEINNQSFSGRETDKDFAHIIASDVYTDNKLQVVRTDTVTRQSNVVFLGSDNTRAEGNRSRLMNFFYSEATNFISDPDNIIVDDDTADYDPYTYYSSIANKTYLVYRNGLTQFDSNSTFKDIAANSDIYFVEHYTGNSWKTQERITNYAGSQENIFANHATISEDNNGNPVIVYYTSPTSDPAGIDESVSHDIYLVTKNNNTWTPEQAFTITGSISDLESAHFSNSQVIAITYTKDDVSKVGLYKKNSSGVYECVNTIDNASISHFIKAGNNYNVLTYLKDGDVHVKESIDEDKLLTDGNIKVPSGDYKIYGSYIGNNIAIISTASKDSKENAYVILSNDSGNNWGKVNLTDVGENASVNEIGLTYTTENEPIIFYSVRHYTDNSTNSNLMHASLANSNGILLGQDDPRFTDGQTDLYVKARKANETIKINDAYFTDEDGARRGKNTPIKIELENTGMYDIASVKVYANDIEASSHEVNLRPGQTTVVDSEVLVDSNANDAINYVIKVKTGDDKGEATYNVVLNEGHISVRYIQEYRYSENMSYYVTNNGFSEKQAIIYLFDEDTGNMFYTSSIRGIAPGTTRESQTSRVSGLFRDDGHINIRAYVLTDDENNALNSALAGKTLKDEPGALDLFLNTVSGNDDLKQLDLSTRYISFKSIDSVYLQDASGIKLINNNTPSNDDDNVEQEEVIDSSSSNKKEEKTDNNSVVPEQVEPKDDKKEETKPEKDDSNNNDEPLDNIEPNEPIPGDVSNSIIPFIIVGIVVLSLFISFIIILIKRKKEQEEE